MKNLLTPLCLTIAVLIRSIGVSESADFQKGMDAYHSGDRAAALRERTPLAELGDPKVQVWKGNMFLMGRGVLEDKKEAVK